MYSVPLHYLVEVFVCRLSKDSVPECIVNYQVENNLVTLYISKRSSPLAVRRTLDFLQFALGNSESAIEKAVY